VGNCDGELNLWEPAVVRRVELIMKERARRRKHGHDRERRRLSARQATGENLRIIALDGEGWTDSEGRHHYMMLCASDGEEDWVLWTGKPLEWWECMEFLCALPTASVRVGFAFGYDVTMMVRGLPRTVLDDIAHMEKVIARNDMPYANHGWTTYGRYRFRWVPSKMFEVWDWQLKRTCKVQDTFAFYQQPFCRAKMTEGYEGALVSWNVGDPAIWKRIAEMKNLRGSFSAQIVTRVKEYCLEECRLLVKLTRKLVAACHEAGLQLWSYTGAGSVASAMLTKHHVKNFMTDPPPEVLEASSYAYFGGRFEASTYGPIPGPIYGYDLCSAYPSIIRNLPCLAHAVWRPLTRYRPGLHAMWKVAWRKWGMYADLYDSLLPVWGLLPWRRSNGLISCPITGAGWYWGAELDVAIRLLDGWKGGGTSLRVYEGWELISTCDCEPFAWVPQYYERRLQLERAGAEAGKIFKLGLNSLYGKTAQKVGKAPFRSLVWAGLITAATRGALLSVFEHLDPRQVVMFATDGVFTRERCALDVTQTKELGKWEEKEYESMLVVQPGVYFLGAERGIRKTRGIYAPSLDYADWRSSWPSTGIATTREIEVQRFIGLRTGLIRKADCMGQWTRETRNISYATAPKRWPGQMWQIMVEPTAEYNREDPLIVPVTGKVKGVELDRLPLSAPYRPGRMSETMAEALMYLEENTDWLRDSGEMFEGGDGF
jgi:hypothetical protein